MIHEESTGAKISAPTEKGNIESSFEQINVSLDKCWTVYCHTTPSDKKYIGITSQPVHLRWGRGSTYKQCFYFYKAIQTYGWDNIKHEILYTHLTLKEANKIEINLIEKYNTIDRQFGYNMTKGGDGCIGRTPWNKGRKGLDFDSEETKKKKSDALKKWRETEDGKKHVEKLLNLHIGSKNSTETIEKRRKKLKGKKRTLEQIDNIRRVKFKPVINLDTGVIYKCVNDAAKALNCHSSTISKWCSKYGRAHRGCNFAYLDKWS